MRDGRSSGIVEAPGRRALWQAEYSNAKDRRATINELYALLNDAWDSDFRLRVTINPSLAARLSNVLDWAEETIK